MLSMTADRKAREKATNAHFMAVLAGAISEAGLDYKDVDERLGLAPGTTSRWMLNKQVMRAPMFVSMATAVDADPVELMSRAVARMKRDGLLKGSTLPPVGQ